MPVGAAHGCFGVGWWGVGGVGSSENSNVPVVLFEIQQTVHTDNCVSCVCLFL